MSTVKVRASHLDLVPHGLEEHACRYFSELGLRHTLTRSSFIQLHPAYLAPSCQLNCLGAKFLPLISKLLLHRCSLVGQSVLLGSSLFEAYFKVFHDFRCECLLFIRVSWRVYVMCFQ